MRLEPQAIGPLAARLADGSAVISATNGKTTTAAMVAAILERSRHAARPQPRGREHGRRRRERCCLTRPRRHRAVRGRRVLARPGRPAELRPRALLLANLFRDQLDRYGELDTIADRWAEVVAHRPAPTSCSTPTTRPSPTWTATAADPAVYFGVEDDAWPCPGSSTPPTPSTAGAAGARTVYDAVFLGPPRALPLHRPGDSAAQPGRRREDVELHGVRAARSRCARRPASGAIELPLPGLYNVYNALGAAALALALGAPLDDVAAGLQAVSPPSAAPRPCTSAAATCRSCSSRTRRARTRSCGRSPRARRAGRARRAERPHRRRARRLVGVGRRLRGARPERAPVRVLRHPRPSSPSG